MLGGRGQVLYVGKASDLRRRLKEHERGTSSDARMRRMARSVREVRTITCSDESEALCREAELIMSLEPSYNRMVAGEEPSFVEVTSRSMRNGRIDLEMRLTTEPSESRGAVYGAFVHLGKGRFAWPAARCKEGHIALMRLLWVTFTEGRERYRMPSRLAATTPPWNHRMRGKADMMEPLRRFLSGESRDLVDLATLAVMDEETPAYMRGPLLRDLEAADRYFKISPAALRERREKHGLGSEPIPVEDLYRIVIEEAHAAVGAFKV